ncbi:MAG: platelet-activating factor acetylhydrolase IB subunit [Aureliella sp.]
MNAVLLLLAINLVQATAEKVDASKLSTTPVVQDAKWAQSWWMKRHEEKLAAKGDGKDVELLWIGDSITHGWENGGKAVWDKFYAKRNAFNLGFSGDRTEHVLWRLENGAVQGMSPKVTVMMIGTNNTGHRKEKAEYTTAGIKAILDQLHERMPETKVLLLAVFPRGEQPDHEMRQINNDVNKQIQRFADGKQVHFLDIGDKFLDEAGVLPEDIMPDALHPNAKGYQIWAEAIEDKLASLLGES